MSSSCQTPKSIHRLYPYVQTLVSGYLRHSNQSLPLPSNIPIALTHIIIELFWIPYFDDAFKLNSSASLFIKLIRKVTYASYTYHYPKEIELLRSDNILQAWDQEPIPTLRKKITKLLHGKLMIIMQIVNEKEYSIAGQWTVPKTVVALELSIQFGRICAQNLKGCKAQIYTLNERKGKTKHIKLSGNLSFGLIEFRNSLALYCDCEKLIDLSLSFNSITLNVSKLKTFGFEWLSGDACESHCVEWKVWNYRKCV